MKLMIVILNDTDVEKVVARLLEEDYRTTRIASTGGFLRRGNTTLLIGTAEDRVDKAIQIIRDESAEPVEEGRSKATVFVLDIAKFEQL
jgi:uncharacterized protein YaaQ